MLKRIMVFVLMLAVMTVPTAIGESSAESTIETLKERITELEKENTELRALLSEKDIVLGSGPLQWRRDYCG